MCVCVLYIYTCVRVCVRVYVCVYEANANIVYRESLSHSDFLFRGNGRNFVLAAAKHTHAPGHRRIFRILAAFVLRL